MIKQILTTVVAVALAASVGSGQEAQAPKPSEAKPQASPARTQAQLVNVRVELTITEQRGGAVLPAKTISMLVADREFGRVRTVQGNGMLNADARPEILPNGRVRVTLSLEYRPPQDEPVRNPLPLLTESLSAILEDGKPQVVSQSADPGPTPATVRVEVKAAILR
jgi:hypothetical protein